MDMRLELVPVPVSNVDKAKEFYVSIGFVADHDQRVNENHKTNQRTLSNWARLMVKSPASIPLA